MDSDLRWEAGLQKEGYAVIAGTDEAGRGPLAGPVVAGAFTVLAPEDEEVLSILKTVTDSKQMTHDAREVAFEKLTSPALKGRVAWAIHEMTPAQIDKTNILAAALSAMAQAVRALDKLPDCVLVDGNHRAPDLLKQIEDASQTQLTKYFGVSGEKATEKEERWTPRKVQAIVGGDAKVASIAAASVLAKVHRDRMMVRLHEEYPVYGFDSHKGYGTAEHLEAIKVHGICPHHRRTFEPIKGMLENANQSKLSKFFGMPTASKPAGALTTTPEKGTKAKKGSGKARKSDKEPSQAKDKKGTGKSRKSEQAAETSDVTDAMEASATPEKDTKAEKVPRKGRKSERDPKAPPLKRCLEKEEQQEKTKPKSGSGRGRPPKKLAVETAQDAVSIVGATCELVSLPD